MTNLMNETLSERRKTLFISCWPAFCGGWRLMAACPAQHFPTVRALFIIKIPEGGEGEGEGGEGEEEEEEEERIQ